MRDMGTRAVNSRRAVTRQEAADMYGVSFDVIKRAINAQQLPAKKVGRTYRVSLDDLAAWWEGLPDA